jgi:hypothetical protein
MKETNQESFSKINGRPKKYRTEEKRKEVRRNQNRLNQIECRRRKRIKLLEQEFSRIIANQKQTNKESNKIYKVKANKFNNDYKETLTEFFNRYDYDTLFTGTLKPNKREENKIKKLKNDNNYQIQRHEKVFDNNISQKMGVNSFIKYTNTYINYLSKINLFERCFYIFEVGKSNHIHVHILFKKNKNIINFNKLLKNYWTIGISNTQTIKKGEKNTMASYCLKELNASSSKNSDAIMIDSWNFQGNFDRINN